ncbi:MAG TPA: hypothetical protein VK176_11100 [Phycisphaerales bacterium]|nr:hypothetical protein [Phycisphaerales bacterium]
MSNILREAQARAWTVWTVATAFAAGLAAFGFQGETSDEGMHELGLLFAAYVLCMGVISGRAKDVTTLLVVLWGGTMGLWCNRWLEMCSRSIAQFGPQLGIGSQSAIESMNVPLAVASAGFVSAGLLLVATRSTRVAWTCVGASILAGGVPFFANDVAHALPWAAVGWNALVAGALAVWAVDERLRRGGDRCRACGTDVHGLTSPVCPRCAAPLAERSRRPGPYVTVPPAQNRRPV